MDPSLFFDEGKRWGRSRRIISPALNGHHNVANMIPAIAKVSRQKSTDALVGRTRMRRRRLYPQRSQMPTTSSRRPCVGPEPLPGFDPTNPQPILADLLAKCCTEEMLVFDYVPPVRVSALSCNVPSALKIGERVCSKLDNQHGGTVEFVQTFGEDDNGVRRTHRDHLDVPRSARTCSQELSRRGYCTGFLLVASLSIRNRIHGTASCRPINPSGRITSTIAFVFNATYAPGRDVFKAFHSRSSVLPLSQTAIRTTLSP